MSTRRAVAAVVLAAAAMAAGCGDEGTEPNADAARTQAEAARTQAEQAVENLSPEARDLLGQAEALAGRTSATGKEYATGDLAPDAAATRFEDLGQSAEKLEQQARALPSTDPAREQLVDLADSTRAAAEELRETAEAGPAPDAGAVEERLRGLQDEGKATFDRYRDQLPAGTRDEIEKAVDELVTP